MAGAQWDPDGAPMSADVSSMMIDLAREAPFRLGAIEVRPATREVVLGERREVLEPRVMQVLVALARRPGEVVSRDQLTESCWGGRIVGEDAISRAIGQLRRLAEAIGGFDLETIPRVGYRLIDPKPASARRRYWWLGGGVAALIVLAAVAAVLWFARPHLSPNGDTKVVVAAIRPLGADPMVQRFSQSLTDNLMGGLGAAAASTGSSASRGADLVVDGVAENDGAELRVSLHLTEGRTGATLWSSSFTALATGKNGLRERATVAVAATVRCAAQARAPRAGSIGIEALRRFLRACSILDEPGATSEILANLRSVTQDAPTFEPGFATLAVFAAEADREVDPILAPPLRAESAAAANRALQLAPKDGTAYQALEMLVEPRSDWAQRQSLLSKGLALDPNNAALAARQGLVLVGQGRLNEAILFQRQAAALNPASANAAAELGDTLAAKGNLVEAARVLIRANDLWPQNSHVAGAQFANAALNGRERDALQMIGNSAGVDEGEGAVWRQCLQAMISGSTDQIAKSRAAIKDAVRTHVVWAPDAVRALSKLGDPQGAIEVAGAFASQHPDYEPTYLFKSGTDSMRRDPRFMALAQSLGLTAYWRSQNRWPDYCSEPGLPYNCQAEAARLAR